MKYKHSQYLFKKDLSIYKLKINPDLWTNNLENEVFYSVLKHFVSSEICSDCRNETETKFRTKRNFIGTLLLLKEHA